MSKILIVSPHPDDEVLGCGGAILYHKLKNDEVYWLTMTNIHESKEWTKKQVLERQKEIKNILNFFKFKKSYNFNYPTASLDTVNSSEIIEKIKKLLNTVKPNIIYLPFIYDPHSDHRITTESFNSCIKPFRHNFIKKVLMYETISETNLNFLYYKKFNPNVFIDIKKHIHKKIKAIKIYKSELGKHPFPRSKDAIMSLSKIRGSQVNLEFAEGFELIYDIKK